MDSGAASGYVPGEGGAILVLERCGSELLDGTRRYGVVAGYAAGFDQPDRPPVLATTIRRALADARVEPSDVDVVFADGQAVPAADLAEADAISAVFGPRAVPVTAPKTLTGRLYGGGAALDVATALLSLRDSVIPHTSGPTRLAPDCHIDLVLGEPRATRLRTALVLARGYGGFTAAVVLRA